MLRMLRSEAGVTAIEYALAAALTGAAIIVGLTAVGSRLNHDFIAIAAAFDSTRLNSDAGGGDGAGGGDADGSRETADGGATPVDDPGGTTDIAHAGGPAGSGSGAAGPSGRSGWAGSGNGGSSWMGSGGTDASSGTEATRWVLSAGPGEAWVIAARGQGGNAIAEATAYGAGGPHRSVRGAAFGCPSVQIAALSGGTFGGFDAGGGTEGPRSGIGHGVSLMFDDGAFHGEGPSQRKEFLDPLLLFAMLVAVVTLTRRGFQKCTGRSKYEDQVREWLESRDSDGEGADGHREDAPLRAPAPLASLSM